MTRQRQEWHSELPKLGNAYHHWCLSVFLGMAELVRAWAPSSKADPAGTKITSRPTQQGQWWSQHEPFT